MRLKKDCSKKKLRGAYYTPLQLADAMVELLASQNISTVLEPSCGDGVFLDALQNLNLLNKVDKLTAVEIEPDEAEKARDRYSEFEQIEVCTEDFFDFYNRVLGKEQYNLILGNPPYIRYQYLKESQREMQSQILTSHGMKANKLINAWVAFIVACVQLLSEKGKIAFVIPAEILQVAYAEDLRLYLANNLAKITLITFEQLVFPDIEQEVIVFIGEKGEEEKGIRIIEMNDLSGFAQLDLSQNGFQKLQHVKEKWTKYFTNVEENKFYDKLRQETGFDKDPRVKFVGTVYDQELLKYIRENAFAYFHGHEVGGTNPSLLEALESTKLNLLLDVGFNREVGEDGAFYWKKDQLASVIDQAEQLDEQAIEDLNQKSSKRIAEAFTWEKIVTDYEKV